jgi:enoyl-CoA hydratase/carnithine racemase
MQSAAVREEPLLLVDRAPPLARITLNRGDKFNALSSDLMTDLKNAIEQLAKDREIRVVTIAGTGRAFCAGHDLREMGPTVELDGFRKLFAQCSDLMLTIQRAPQPVIARVHGVATAAGCQLVAMCDLAVASSDARFAVSGINLGLFCATPSVALGRNVLRKQAMEMLLTGDFIDAETARVRGLVNRVVPPQQLDEEVERLATQIASKPRDVIAAGKALFYRQLELGIEGAYQCASEAMACNAVAGEARQGIQAFIAKAR